MTDEGRSGPTSAGAPGPSSLGSPRPSGSRSSPRFRLLETGEGSPAWNMALDEALLEEWRAGAPPVLRLYRWRPAALSLGRFQRLVDLGEVPASVPRVRRITGGGALHHREDELTYSIVAPYSLFHGERRGSPKVAYHAVHEAIRLGLVSLGLALEASAGDDAPGARVSARAPLCYDLATDFDLKAAAGKLVGSAQRRKGEAFLQHGSIPVSPDPFSRGAVSLGALLGRVPSPGELAAAVRSGFERALGARLEPGAVTPAEAALARTLEREKYDSPAWTAEKP